MQRARSLIGLLTLAGCATPMTEDALPSWNDTASKQRIIAFVERVTTPNSPDFVPAAERIATFDNDGTLWAEQPLYFQLLFAFDRIRAAADQHPEWRQEEPFRSVLAGDHAAALAGGNDAIVKIIMASHGELSAEEFRTAVAAWLEKARHPTTGRRYDEMVYAPMLELLAYLRMHGFKTFIVSGGGADFMRVFAERVYGIPPEQVVGSSLGAAYEMRDGTPTIVKRSADLFLDDGPMKPVAIHRQIGRRPILAAGNSDGDQQMLEFTTIDGGRGRGGDHATPRLGLLVRHTDADREWAYDRDSHIGRLNSALDAAPQRGWVVVDMRSDWSIVFR